MQAIADARDREAWLRAKQGGIGASEVAAVLGLDAFSSPVMVWARKTGRLKGDSTQRMRNGSRMEDGFLQAYCEEVGRKARRAQELLADPEQPRLMATPDIFDEGPSDEPGLDDSESIRRFRAFAAEVSGVGVVDTKFTRQEPWGEEAPLYYQLQIQAQLAVTGLSWGAVAAMHGNEIWVYPLARHEKVIARIRDAVGRFWRDYVERDREPPASVPADLAAVVALHSKDSGRTIELAPEHVALVEEWLALKEKINEAYRRKDVVEAQIQQALADATWGTLPDGRRLQWKVEPRKGHAVKPSEPRVLRLVKG